MQPLVKMFRKSIQQTGPSAGPFDDIILMNHFDWVVNH